MAKYLIVGAGLSGCVIAERLASIGHKVTIIDKRNHIGGNCYDYYYAGVLIHKYGLHYLRTNSKRAVDYLSKFTKWRHYECRTKSEVNGDLFDFPINRNTINKFFKIKLKDETETMNFLSFLKRDLPPELCGNSEEAIVSKCGWLLYEAFFKNYTKKQWGLDPKELDASVCSRIPIRTNNEDRYSTAKFQVVPLDGYTKMFEKMLDNPNIKIKLEHHSKDLAFDHAVMSDLTIWTGRIDEFFNYKFGRLPYRSLIFKPEELKAEYAMTVPFIYYPGYEQYTRKVEIKHLTGQKCPNTVIVTEYPTSDGEPCYPIPTKENQELYKKYEKESKKIKKVEFLGRLAEYKYYNMDDVIEKALDLFEKIKQEVKEDGK